MRKQSVDGWVKKLLLVSPRTLVSWLDRRDITKSVLKSDVNSTNQQSLKLLIASLCKTKTFARIITSSDQSHILLKNPRHSYMYIPRCLGVAVDRSAGVVAVDLLVLNVVVGDHGLHLVEGESRPRDLVPKALNLLENRRHEWRSGDTNKGQGEFILYTFIWHSTF